MLSTGNTHCSHAPNMPTGYRQQENVAEAAAAARGDPARALSQREVRKYAERKSRKKRMKKYPGGRWSSRSTCKD